MDHASFIGKRFGNLEVIGVGTTNKHRKKNFIVKCIKHTDIIPYEVVKQSLVIGATTGCPICKSEKYQTHGKSGSKIYNAYKGIIGRILDSNHKDYNNYGKRGIDIDPKYNPMFENQGLEKAFNNFYADIGDIPQNLTIDRIDVNKGYWKNI